MKKVILKIDGMTCSACSSGLEKYLNKQNGIEIAVVNLVMETASIEYDDRVLSIENLEKFIEKAGFKSLGIDNFEKNTKKAKSEKYKLIIVTVLSIILLYISMAHMINMPDIPFLSMNTHPINYIVALFILATLVIILCIDILKNGIKNLIHLTPNMDTLVMIGVFSSYIYSIIMSISIFKGNISNVHNLYFESAAVVLFFIKIGKYVEGKNKDKTKEALEGLMTITPNHATIIKDNKERAVTIDEIEKGDIVVCKPGEKIAVDGVIIDGKTHIDESFITGESTLVCKEKSSNVIAGSINYEGTIKYRAERIGKDSTVSEIVKMVTETTNTKAPIAKIADKVSGYFVPSIIILAFITGIIWLIISKNVSTSLNVFISILVVACPCSLGLAVPLAIVISSGKASQKGILIKTSEVLENAHKVKTVVFDKTGTLTKGKLSISKIYNYTELEEREILKIVSSIEEKSEHPISKGVVNYAKELEIESLEVTDFEAVPGFGIKAKIDNKEYLIGNKSLMIENNVSCINEKDAEELMENGNTIIFVACNNKVIAIIGVKDTLRENAKEVIEKLKSRNIDVVMLTGDNEKVAKIVAGSVGIENVISSVKPNEKAHHVNNLKKNGLVMMCGDGINDSVSLVSADIGVSMGKGTDIAMNSSNVILVSDNLEKIDELINISKKTVQIIKQNLFWAFFYNILMIPIAMGILTPVLNITLNPMLASLAMTISSLTVVLNALRLRKI